MQAIWKKLLTELKTGRSGFIALVAESNKSSPGKKSNLLLLTDNGKQFGTIGGGRMEANIVEKGKLALQSERFQPQLIRLDHYKETPNPSGLICGGSQTCILMRFEASMIETIQKWIQALEGDYNHCLSLTAGGCHFTANSKMSANIVMEESEHAWRVNLSSLNRKRTAVFGGGHCGAALAEQMLKLGYKVSIVEPRHSLFTLSSLSSCRLIQANNYAEGAALIDYPEFTFVAILTPSLETDIEAAAAILRRPFPFIGLMGSNAKINQIKSALFLQGFSKKDWLRIHAPAGLPINSHSPEEIAVSISAQILQLSHQLGLR